MALPVRIRSSQTSNIGALPVRIRSSQTSNLGADYQAQIEQLQAALHDLALSIGEATRTGQLQAAAMLRQQFNAMRAQVDGLVAQQGQVEAPSGVETFFANAANAVSGIGGKVALAAGLGVVALLVLPRLLPARGRA